MTDRENALASAPIDAHIRWLKRLKSSNSRPVLADTARSRRNKIRRNHRAWALGVPRSAYSHRKTSSRRSAWFRPPDKRTAARSFILEKKRGPDVALAQTTSAEERRAINCKPGLGGTSSRIRPSTVRERPGRPALRHKPAPAHNKPAAAQAVTPERRRATLRR